MQMLADEMNAEKAQKGKYILLELTISQFSLAYTEACVLKTGYHINILHKY